MTSTPALTCSVAPWLCALCALRMHPRCLLCHLVSELKAIESSTAWCLLCTWARGLQPPRTGTRPPWRSSSPSRPGRGLQDLPARFNGAEVRLPAAAAPVALWSVCKWLLQAFPVSLLSQRTPCVSLLPAVTSPTGHPALCRNHLIFSQNCVMKCKCIYESRKIVFTFLSVLCSVSLIFQ